MVNKYTTVTCYIFYFIARLYIYRYFSRCLFDKSRGTKTFHKIFRGTSAKKVKKPEVVSRERNCQRTCGVKSSQ